MPDRPPHDFAYVHTDIPEGMTIREWRRRTSNQRQSAALRSQPGPSHAGRHRTAGGSSSSPASCTRTPTARP